MSSDSSATARRRTPDPRLPVRAGHLLRARAVWTIPMVVASVVVAVVTTLYISSVVNPPAHLRGLPVAVVNQDQGATAGPQHLQIGQQVQAGLLASPAVSGRLHLVMSTLPQAEAAMGRDGLYAALVIPPGFTASLLTVAGLHTAGPAASAVPQIQILTNERAGTVGASLAAGILQPALAAASRQIGRHLATLAAALGLLFWLALGTATVKWYDRKNLYRLHPDLLAHVSHSGQDYETGQATPASAPSAPAPSDTRQAPSSKADSRGRQETGTRRPRAVD